jgi:hypothetical protein
MPDAPGLLPPSVFENKLIPPGPKILSSATSASGVGAGNPAQPVNITRPASDTKTGRKAIENIFIGRPKRIKIQPRYT